MKTRLHKLSLKFESEALERAYLKDAFSDYALPLRYGLIVGVTLYGGYVWVDQYLFGQLVGELLVNRALVCTLALAVLGLTYHRSFARLVRPGMSVLHVAVGLGAIHMSTLHPSYEGGLYAALAFFPLLARAQFQLSMAVNAVLFVGVVAFRSHRTGLGAELVDLGMLFSALVVVGLGAYVKEQAARTGFLQKRALARTRDRALAASRAKSTFLANMSHELRTPLNAIIGYGELLQEDLREAGQEQHLGDLDKVVSSGKYLLRLINDILDLSKIEAGKVELLAQEFDVRELADAVTTTVAPLVKRSGNDLETTIAGDVGMMHSDPTRVRQILFNLLSNAAKFTHEGKVTLDIERCRSDGVETVLFTVTDTGIGMSEEQLTRIFDAFSQAEASTTRDYGGTGLGLTITKHFAEMLGGRVAVQSAPGAGSCFQVWLPRAFDAVPASAAPESDGVDSG